MKYIFSSFLMTLSITIIVFSIAYLMTYLEKKFNEVFDRFEKFLDKFNL